MSDATFQKSTLREYFESIVVAVILALFVRTFVFQAFKIPTGLGNPQVSLRLGTLFVSILQPTSRRDYGKIGCKSRENRLKVPRSNPHENKGNKLCRASGADKITAKRVEIPLKLLSARRLASR